MNPQFTNNLKNSITTLQCAMNESLNISLNLRSEKKLLDQGRSRNHEHIRIWGWNPQVNTRFRSKSLSKYTFEAENKQIRHWDWVITSNTPLRLRHTRANTIEVHKQKREHINHPRENALRKVYCTMYSRVTETEDGKRTDVRQGLAYSVLAYWSRQDTGVNCKWSPRPDVPQRFPRQ